MSKQSKTGRDAVALAFVDAYTTAETSGSKIEQACRIALQAYKGEDVPKDDVDYITDKLATARGWTGVALKVRKSEARKVIGVYNTLPEGIKLVREKRGSCDWRSALKLATCLKKHGGKLKPAMAAFETQEGGSTVSPAGRAAGALKGWYKKATPAKRKAILEAAALLGLKLGIKLDA